MSDDDARLVARALDGDERAVAELYDRYSDRLFDYARRLTRNSADAADIVQDTFVTAMRRLPQLRDHSRVRPWLYAITRSEVHRRHRRVNRLQYGAFDDGAEPTQPAWASSSGDAMTERTAVDIVHQRDVRLMIQTAADGLADDDREVLDLYLRHGLNGAEMADALQIPERHVSVTMQRVRERLARGIGIVLLTGAGCETFRQLRGTQGEDDLTPLSRKRLARHIDECTECTAQQNARMRPEVLLGAAPMLLAPAALRTPVLSRVGEYIGSIGGQAATVPGAAEGIASTGGTAVRMVAREGRRQWLNNGFPIVKFTSARRLAAIALLVSSGGLATGVAVLRDPPDRARIASGATTTTLADDGVIGPPVSPEATPSKADPSTTPPEGSAASTSTTQAATDTVVTSIVPTAPPPTTVATTVATVVPTSPPPAPTTTAPDVTQPVIGAPTSDQLKIDSLHPLGGGTCFDQTTAQISVSITDDRGVTSVTMTYDHENGPPRQVPMSLTAGAWRATVGPIPAAEVPTLSTWPIDVTITARDAAGNQAVRVAPALVKIDGCPIVT